MLRKADALQDAATVSRHLVELYVAFLGPLRLEALEQTVNAHLHSVLLFLIVSYTILLRGWEVNWSEATLLSERIVGIFYIFFLR